MHDANAFLFAGFVLVITGTIVASGPRKRSRSFREALTSSGSIALGLGLLLVIYGMAGTLTPGSRRPKFQTAHFLRGMMTGRVDRPSITNLCNDGPIQKGLLVPGASEKKQ